jgi:hypothetical protein
MLADKFCSVSELMPLVRGSADADPGAGDCVLESSALELVLGVDDRELSSPWLPETMRLLNESSEVALSCFPEGLLCPVSAVWLTLFKLSRCSEIGLVLTPASGSCATATAPIVGVS